MKTPELKLPTKSWWYWTKYMNQGWIPRYVEVTPSGSVCVDGHWSTCPTFHALWKIGRRIIDKDPMNPIEPDSRDESLAEVERLKAELAAATKSWPDDAPRVGIRKTDTERFVVQWAPQTGQRWYGLYLDDGTRVDWGYDGYTDINWLTPPPPQPSLIDRARKALADAGIDGLDVVVKGGE